MEEKIRELKAQIEEKTGSVPGIEELKEIRFNYLSKNGAIPALMKQLGSLSKEERPAVGKLINEFKAWATERFDEQEKRLSQKALEMRYEREQIDVTMPANTLKAAQTYHVTFQYNKSGYITKCNIQRVK